MTDQPQHTLTEQITDRIRGTYTREWYCDPPAEDIRFRVVRAEWTSGQTVQKVYEIKTGDVW